TQVCGRSSELPQSSQSSAEGVELVDREPAFGIRSAEVGEPLQQVLNHARCDRLMDAWDNLDITCVIALLPGVWWRDYDISADEFAPVHVISERCREQACPVPVLTKNAIRVLENSDSRPFEIAGIRADVFLFHHDLQPIIETAD